MTDEFSIVTYGNRKSFIHGTHTVRSPITPINLNKTQVCQHHPSPPAVHVFWRHLQGHQLLLWDRTLTSYSLRHFYSSARSPCCLLLTLMRCPSHMARVFGGPDYYVTCLALHFALSMKFSDQTRTINKYISPGFDSVVIFTDIIINVTITEGTVVP